MKVKGLTNKIIDLAESEGCVAEPEHFTPDRTRIDVAVLRGEKKLVAVEFERTYKWIRRRILYNGIKAYRAGFKELFLIYPFQKKSVPNSWVLTFLEDLGLNVRILHPNKCLEEVRRLITER